MRTKPSVEADLRTLALTEKPESSSDLVVIPGEDAGSADKDLETIIYPSAFRLTLITISLSVAFFLVSLDRTILAPAM